MPLIQIIKNRVIVIIIQRYKLQHPVPCKYSHFIGKLCILILFYRQILGIAQTFVRLLSETSRFGHSLEMFYWQILLLDVGLKCFGNRTSQNEHLL